MGAIILVQEGESFRTTQKSKKSDFFKKSDFSVVWKFPPSCTRNQIVVRSDNYTTFQLGGHAFLKIPSLQRGKRIAIPLNTMVEPTGTFLLKRTERQRLGLLNLDSSAGKQKYPDH